MGQVHDLIARVGQDQARQESKYPSAVEVAATMMSIETETIGVTYSGFALTSLPHKRLSNDQTWEKQGHRVRLLIEPGTLPSINGGYRRYGVPYGSQARLILIYLQSEAIRRNSPEIELGSSMYQWLQRMGVSAGGKTYSSFREQANRLSACLLTFTWTEGRRIAFSKDSIVRAGLFLPSEDDDRQQNLWSESVVLSDTFFRELRDHAVPLSEEAIAQINNNSFSIDIYIWLAYRLHSLSGPQPITWSSLHEQFGTGYSRLRDFRKRFTDSLNLALAVYQDAVVDIHEEGVTLHPSRPPIARRPLALRRPK